MTTSTEIAKTIEYGKLLDGIRTELASVMSKIDSTTKYEIDGALTPELIMSSADDTIAAQSDELDAMLERVEAIISTLENMEVPSEPVGSTNE